MRAERRVKKMKGNLIDQLIMYVQHPPCATREAVGWRWVTLAVRVARYRHVKSGKERDRWAWCTGWVINFMGSLIVYWSNLMPVTANHTCVCVAKSLLAGPVREPHRLLCCVLHARFLSMLFVVCMCVLGVTYPMLTFGNPGKVTEDTPKVRPACCRACTARSGVLGKGRLTKFSGCRWHSVSRRPPRHSA